MITKTRATIEDLNRVSEKAEVVNGGGVKLGATGDEPGHARGEVFAHLRGHAQQSGEGRALPDNVGFCANLPHRDSFSPDAAFYKGPRSGMKFLPHSPALAVEVRSEGGYGPQAERDMADKRADYFAAGTPVVWDVDLLNDDVVRVFRVPASARPSAIYRRGDMAEAEPAVPDWTMPVNDLFL